MKGISIIIPCHKEDITKVVNTAIKDIVYLRKQKGISFKKISFEIVIVDDKDNIDLNRKKLISHKNITIKLLDNITNFGKGYSIVKGLNESKYNIKVVVDADFSVSIKELESDWKLNYSLEVNKKKPYLLVGHRIYNNERPLKRKIMSFLHKKLIKILFDFPVSDTQCPYKVYYKIPKKYYDYNNWNIFGFEHDVEAIQNAKNIGVDIFSQSVLYNFEGNTTIKNDTWKKMLKELIILKNKKKVH